MALTTKTERGYMAEPRPSPNGRPIQDTMIIGDRVHKIHTVVVNRFRISEAEDPDLLAGEPLWQWQQSEMGQWVMAKAVQTPEWHRNNSLVDWQIHYAIVAKLKDVDYTFWQLKWGS